MAADVGRHFRSNKRDLVTRDFLSCAVTGSKELDLDHKIPFGWERRLDLDHKIPFGWERRLDLSSGETTYIERSKSDPKLQDLNLPPASKDNTTLDLKALLPSCPRSNYQSVCTLDKVKYALERAKRESQTAMQRSNGSDSNSCSSESVDGSDSSKKLVAAGCPSCLMYVLVSKESPKCPRCAAEVPSDIFGKKRPKIDLNC